MSEITLEKVKKWVADSKQGLMLPSQLAKDFAELFVKYGEALIANDALIRDIRNRDSRWHDDEAVQRILAANKELLGEK